jgi:F420-0:gamma-glutamyl ligase-like protein
MHVPHDYLQGQYIFGMRGFLTTYCDKKRGAVVCLPQSLRVQRREDRNIVILCAMAVSLYNHNFIDGSYFLRDTHILL